MKKKLLALLAILILMILGTCTIRPPKSQVFPLDTPLRQQPAGGFTLLCGNEDTLFYTGAVGDYSHLYGEIWRWDRSTGEKKRVASHDPLSSFLTEDTFFYTTLDTLHAMPLNGGETLSIRFARGDDPDWPAQHTILTANEKEVRLAYRKTKNLGAELDQTVTLYQIDLSSKKAKKLGAFTAPTTERIYFQSDGQQIYANSWNQWYVYQWDGTQTQTMPGDIKTSFHINANNFFLPELRHNVFLYEDRFYYVDVNGNLASCKKDGTDKKELLSIAGPLDSGQLQLMGDTLFYSTSAQGDSYPLYGFSLTQEKATQWVASTNGSAFLATPQGVFVVKTGDDAVLFYESPGASPISLDLFYFIET
jgi:hypothetical protein